MFNDTQNQQTLRLLFFESTVKCNLSCAHCRRIETDEKVSPDMDTQQAKLMIRQLFELGSMQNFMPLLVFSGGEPLCRDDIFELVEYAKDKDMQVAIATNGTLITQDTAHKIKALQVYRVSVSLDGANADTHNKLRKLLGSFESAIDGIKLLKQFEVDFQINVTITQHNAHQLDEIINFAQSIGAIAVHLFMLVPVGCGREFAQDEMLNAGQYERMLTHIAKIEQNSLIPLKVTCGPHYERIKRQSGILHNKTSKGCLAGSGVIFVSHKGDVFPCGYLPVNCGNVLKIPIKDIWANSPDLANMRNTDLLEGKCSICGYRNVCGGCRARAYAATSNYMAEEPFCDYQPDEETT